MRFSRFFSLLHEIAGGGPDAGTPVPDPSQGALISAHFGLDGVPVVFETELDAGSLDAGDFVVTTASGETGNVHVATVFPAP